MRLALDRIGQLYQTNPVFQDLLETGAGAAVAAAGQALATDMTPEEIALSSGAVFAAGMLGRPILGRAGQAVGGYVDRNYPQVGRELEQGMIQARNMMPGVMGKMFDAKMAPYTHLGGAQQYGNLIGRGYGDNIAQALIALSAPGIFGENDEQS